MMWSHGDFSVNSEIGDDNWGSGHHVRQFRPRLPAQDNFPASENRKCLPLLCSLIGALDSILNSRYQLELPALQSPSIEVSVRASPSFVLEFRCSKVFFILRRTVAECARKVALGSVSKRRHHIVLPLSATPTTKAARCPPDIPRHLVDLCQFLCVSKF